MPRGQRVEHTYRRNGALTYLAAWDVRRGEVIGRCEANGGIEPFGRLVQRVMTRERYASAPRVFWIVDNGSSHRGKRSVDRLQGQWPTLQVVHTPVHASWVNQIEIYFSIVQRKCGDAAPVDRAPRCVDRGAAIRGVISSAPLCVAIAMVPRVAARMASPT